jgi:hypothetical protein
VEYVHTCAPPRDEATKPQSLWVCAACGAVWEAAPEGPGIFDFERDEAVTRAVWILVEGPALLAG